MAPEIKTLITTWVCDFCGRSAAHVHGTGTPQLADEFMSTAGWIAIDEDTVTCDRCKVLPDVANRILAQNRVGRR